MFEYINEMIQEASMETCDAILNYIDKCETYTEFETSKEFDEYVQESMLYFMEAVSKDKDEITKWMAKKGYWYDGDNPKKKKECNRMYQFLKQHGYRPSDGTYLSDMDDGKGGKKRIKLNIDDETWTAKDAVRLKELKQKGYDNLTGSEKDEYAKLKEERDDLDIINKGANAFYNTIKKDITLGSKTMKQKQFHSQQTLKHEEGHADSYARGKDGKGVNRDLPKDHPANKAIAEHKGSRKYVNSHDDSSEELMADAYAAKHAKIRNGKAGSKNAKGLRNMTESEIKRSLNSLFALMGGTESAIKKLKETNSNKIKKIDDSINELKNIKVDKIELTSVKDFYDSFADIVDKIGSKYNLFLVNCGTVSDSDGSKTFEGTQGLLEFNDIIDDDYCKKFREISDEIKAYKAFQKALTSRNNTEVNKCIKQYPDIWATISRYGTREIKEDLTKLEETLDKYIKKTNMKISLGKKEAFLKFDNYMKHDQKDNANKILQEFVNPIIKELERMKNISMRLIKDTERCLKETHELRANFASSYIKEYFEEFLNDYIYND